jgi:hypothetical protein
MAGDVISPWTRWTPKEIAELKRLASSQTLFRREIAEQMGKRQTSVNHMMRKLGLNYRVKERYGEWNAKHNHLREPVMRYFLTHSKEETREHFKLTESELKSIFTIGYRDPKYKHLRKDKRRHDPWTAEELVFLAQNAGVQPRAWISKKLKRGTAESAKEALSRMKVGCRYLNGMPWSWAQEIFDWEAARPLVIKTKAGPRGTSGHHRRAVTRYHLIPWTDCERLLEAGLTKPILGKGNCTDRRRAQAPRLKIAPEIETCIHALAQFQRWIHGKRSCRGVRSQIETALRRR